MGIKRERATNWVDSFLILFFYFPSKKEVSKSQGRIADWRSGETMFRNNLFLGDLYIFH